MDIQVILIGAVVFIISAVVIYLISAIAMKETTFDEVIAEQKRQDEKEKAQAKIDKKQEKEGKKKGKKKEKTKEKATPVSEVDVIVNEHKMVNLEIDPEIIEPADVLPEDVKAKSKSKKSPKSILINKDEKVSVDASKPVKEIKPDVPPKDELELKHENEKNGRQQQVHHKVTKKTESQLDKPTKEVKNTQKVQEELTQSEIKMHTAAVPPPHANATEKKTTKSKHTTSVADGPQVDGSFVLSTVKAASLSEADAQLLIDFLVNKYGGAGIPRPDWNKKSKGADPVSLLRKQLEEKERSLQEEQQMAMSANNKWKDLKHELTHQKTNHTAIEKQLTEKMSVMVQEKCALQARMQQTHEQHILEMEHMQSQIQQLEDIADEARLQHLTEENKMLKEKLAQKQKEPQVDVSGMRQTMSILENELSSNVTKLNAAENGKKSLENKMTKYEEQIKKLEQSEKEFDLVLNKRLDEVNKALRQEEARSSSLNKDLQKAKATNKSANTQCDKLKHKLDDLQKANDVLKIAENECNTLKTRLSDLEKTLSANDHSKELEDRLKDSETEKSDMNLQLQDLQIQLEDSERKKSNLESNIKNLEKKSDDLDRERRDRQSESDKLLRDNSSLQEKLKHDQRYTSDLERNIKNLENMTKDYDQQRQNIEKELEQLRKENKALAVELSMEKEKPVEITIETEKPLGANAPNGDVQQEEAEILNKITLVEHEKMISEKENELMKLVSELDGRKKDISEFEEQLETQKRKNNELREKNWKAMEALEKAEQSLSEKLQGAIQNATDQHSTEKYDKEIVQRIFPNISLKETVIESDVTHENDETDFSAQSNDAHKEWMSRFENEAIVYLDSLSSRTASSGAEVENLQKEIEEREAKVKDLEDSNNNLQSQIQDYRSLLTQTGAEVENLQKEIEEREAKVKFLEDSNNNLQSQIHDYRSVLTQTENKLQELENSVELEEMKWQERIQNTQSDLEQAKQEMSVLSEEMQKYRGSHALEDKVQTLQSSLHASEDRYQLVQQQSSQAEEKISHLEEKLEETRKAVININDISKDLEELRRLLEGEKKKNKELAFSHVKLNGIIKTGQDALQQEHDLVKKLQEQLIVRNKEHGTGFPEVGEAATGTGDAGSTTTL